LRDEGIRAVSRNDKPLAITKRAKKTRPRFTTMAAGQTESTSAKNSKTNAECRFLASLRISGRPASPAGSSDVEADCSSPLESRDGERVHELTDQESFRLLGAPTGKKQSVTSKERKEVSGWKWLPHPVGPDSSRSTWSLRSEHNTPSLIPFAVAIHMGPRVPQTRLK